MDRLLTGRRIINSENHFRELWPFLTKKLAKSGYFDCFCIVRTNHPGNLKFAGALSAWQRQKRAARRKQTVRAACAKPWLRQSARAQAPCPCLMLCYGVYFVSIGLERQANSTSYDTCMHSDIFAENFTFIKIVAGFCKLWVISIFAFVSFFATNSLYNIIDLRNNELSWFHKTFVVETGALIFVDLCYNNPEISQITILVR